MNKIFFEISNIIHNKIVYPNHGWIQQIFRKYYNQHLSNIKDQISHSDNPLFKQIPSISIFDNQNFISKIKFNSEGSITNGKTQNKFVYTSHSLEDESNMKQININKNTYYFEPTLTVILLTKPIKPNKISDISLYTGFFIKNKSDQWSGHFKTTLPEMKNKEINK